MTYKALLADDSLTIQKVIKITLAHEPFELTICQNEEQLKEKLIASNASIIFLDFSLSDNKSGYQLCSELLKLKKDLKVLMLYGTFDNIDETALHACGAKEKIIKPFDSVKFIDLCRKMAESDGGESSEIYELEKSFADSNSSSEDDWVVREEVSSKSDQGLHVVENEIEDWGVPVPGVIIEEGSEKNLEVAGAIPPVIEDLSVVQNKVEELVSLPKSEDLEYPDLSISNSTNLSIERSTPQLQSLDEFSDIDDDDQPISLDEVLGTKTVEEVQLIEDAISDEVEEDDLWIADEVLVEESIKQPEIQLKELNKVEDKAIEKPAKDIKTESLVKESDLDELYERLYKKLKKDIQEQLKSELEEIVKTACKNSVDNIAWEVIPDLAENLIRSEISKISSSVIDD